MFKNKVIIARIACALLASAAFMHDTLAQTSTEGSRPESCHALASVDTSADLSATQVESALENLADLKIKIESMKALGSQADNAIILSALNYEFRNKFQFIFEKLVSFKLVSSKEEFVARMKDKIVDRFKVVSAAATGEASARAAEKDSLQFIEFAKKARFYDLKPGEFSFGGKFDSQGNHHIKIDQPFAMMDTDLSQAMWVWLNLLGGLTDPKALNPSYYKSERDGPETFIHYSDGNSSVGLVPDLPVEYVSNDQAVQFLKDLNRISMSDDDNIHVQIRRAFPDHQKGSYYALPTLQQMIFVQSNRGANTSKYFDSEIDSEVWNYAWTGGESNSTRPVKSKKPRMIDTGYGVQVPFYDLVGNVWKLTKSTYLERNQNPLDAPIFDSWAVTGGAVESATSFTTLGASWPQDSWPKKFTGLRLIRYASELRAQIQAQERLEEQDKLRRAKELHTTLTKVHAFKDIVLKSLSLEFADIKADDFVLRLSQWDDKVSGLGPLDIPAKLSRNFAIATTPVTQMVWSKIQLMRGETDPAKINPAKFKGGRQSFLVEENGIQFRIRPDNPIESISSRDVSTWLTDLNQLSNDRSPGVQESLKELIPGHERGDVYDLPVLAQMGFAIQNRGKNNQRFFDRDDSSEFSQYSVCDENSHNQTLPVKSLKPRMIDQGNGKSAALFDLIGNVAVMVKDHSSRDKLSPSTMMSDTDKNPIYIQGLRYCGAPYNTNDSPDSYGAYVNVDNTPDRGFSTIGIRLVRYRHQSFWRKFF